MKELILTKGKVALVDDEDYEMLSKYKWSYCRSGYARRGFKVHGVTYNMQMHNQIMGCKGIDHIDGDKLNNQRHNLRLATPSQNQWNKGVYKNNTSGVKGVTWNKVHKQWVARVQAHGKTYQKTSVNKTVVEQWLISKREELHAEYARH